MRVEESLWAIEDELAALLDSVALVEDDTGREQIYAEISMTLGKCVQKRDQVAAWLAREQAGIAAIDSEIARLQGLRESRCHRIEKVENYVMDCILARGTDSKGRFQKLEGATSRFSVKKNPPAAEITDAAAIPERFESVTLQFSADDWKRFADQLPVEVYAELAEHIKARSASKPDLRRALEAGEEVPGARMAPAKYRLVRE